MTNEQFIKILRVRHFLEHNHEQITKIESEYTVQCTKDVEVDNIFLTFKNFLPNLKIRDSEGTEYPIMTNPNTKLLLDIMKEENQDVDKLIQQINKHKIFLIWIKIPPHKKLKPNEVRILYINFENEKNTNKKNMITINVSSDLPFPVFWIFKKPKDYNIKDQYCYRIDNNKFKNKMSWKKKVDGVFYYENTPISSTLLIHANQKHVTISYSFTPKISRIALPIASTLLLTSFSLFLIIVQLNEELSITFNNVLEHNLELALFIVSSSFIVPRFISNIEVRHTYFWFYFIPITLAIAFFFTSTFNNAEFNICRGSCLDG